MSEREIDPFIEDIAAELKRPVRFDSGLESRVMAALDPAVTPLPTDEQTRTPWLLRPRILYVSPLAGFAVAAGIVAIVTMSVLNTVPKGNQLAASSDSAREAALPTPSFITPVFDPGSGAAPLKYAAPFTYVNPNARSVAVVGSFNDWDATRDVLTRTSDSVWSATIKLPPGRYEYQLVVDGKWIADPNAQRSADSDFGGANSVLNVSPVPR